MKKIAFWFAVLSATFLLGLGVSAFFFVYSFYFPQVFTPATSQISFPAQIKFACDESKSFPGISQKLSEIKKGKSGYFPAQSWQRYKTEDDFINDWYGKHLKAMGESSLLDASDENIEIYRFLWLRTFHHPIFVRIERTPKQIKLFTKELDGAGGYNPGKVLRVHEVVLEQEDFCKFLSLLEKADYWNLPVRDNDMGNDGAEWILEGVKKGRYYAVDKWSPKNGDFRDACVYLLKLSGIDVDQLKGDLY